MARIELPDDLGLSSDHEIRRTSFKPALGKAMIVLLFLGLFIIIGLKEGFGFAILIFLATAATAIYAFIAIGLIDD